MTQDELLGLSKHLYDQRWRLMIEKNDSYASNVDCLFNFDEAGRALGKTPEEILAVYFHKQISSILTYCRDPKAYISEGIESRIMDAANYLDLLYGMVKRGRP